MRGTEFSKPGDGRMPRIYLRKSIFTFKTDDVNIELNYLTMFPI